MLRWSVLLATLLALCACSSSRPGGRYLYKKGDDASQLANSEIRMVTRRRVRGDSMPDERVLRCVAGKITASIKSPRRRVEGSATVPVSEYAALWSDFHEKAMTLNIEPLDSNGGYYHLLSVTLGQEFNEFSAQSRSNFLGVADNNIALRMDLANALVELIDRHVTPSAMPEEAADDKKKPR